MLTSKTYLVRHGDYKRQPEELTIAGVADSERARNKLLALGLGETTTVLSSDAPRALGTAQIIADGLGVEVIPSRRMNEGGNEEMAIRNLDEWILKAFQEASIVLNDNPLVIVTHEPLMGVVSREVNDTVHVGNGEIIQYEPGTWSNPHFRPNVAAEVEHDIQTSLG